MARTQEEIQRQIEGLKHERTILPQFSHFNDNNWGKIDAQLEVLSGGSSDDYEHESDEIYDAAVEAEDWLRYTDTDDLFSEVD